MLIIELPYIDPIFLNFYGIKIYWYGIIYAFGIISTYLTILYSKTCNIEVKNMFIKTSILLYILTGIIIGSRLGNILFYQPYYYLNDPIEIFKIWNGGMSFHGGIIGIVISILIFCYKNNKDFIYISDNISVFAPIGIGIGKLGNFINCELYGIQSNSLIGVIFPNDPYKIPRHPTQIYEFIFEGIILFLILKIYKDKEPPKICISGLFLIICGFFRFMIELLRDQNYMFNNILTIGQLLSLLMIISGFILTIIGYNKNILIAKK